MSRLKHFSNLAILCFIVVTAAFPAALKAQERAMQKSDMPNRCDTIKGKLGIERTCYDALHYNLSIRMDIDSSYLSGSNNITLKYLSKTPELQIDLAERLKINSISSNQTPLKYRRDCDGIFIKTPSEWQPGKTYSITVAYEGKPRLSNKPPWDGGLVRRVDAMGRPFIGVAVQGVGASQFYPCKEHLADEPDSASITITCPDSLTAIANGRLSKVIPMNKGYKSWQWKVTYPINNYCISFYIGKYKKVSDTYRGKNGNLSLDYWVLDYVNADSAKRFFTSEVKSLMTVWEEKLGPYPFYRDGYKLVQAPYWGMEHQSGIAYGNDFKRNPFGFDFIVVHETGHEWWGNNLSATDNAFHWIHEAFCTYSEYILLESTKGKRIADAYLLEQRKRIVNKHKVEGDSAVAWRFGKDSDLYFKGTWMIQTIRTIMQNDPLFFSILQRLQKDYALKTINSRDFQQYFIQKSGRDLTPVFRQYLYEPKIPTIKYFFRGGKMYFKMEDQVQGFRMPFYVNFGLRWQQYRASRVWRNIELPFKHTEKPFYKFLQTATLVNFAEETSPPENAE